MPSTTPRRTVSVPAITHARAIALARAERRPISTVIALALEDRAAALKTTVAKPEDVDHV